MRAKEIRERDEEELVTMLEDAKAQLFRMRLDNATHQLDNTSKIPATRREIAKINTVLAERARAKESTSADAQGDEE